MAAKTSNIAGSHSVRDFEWIDNSEQNIRSMSKLIYRFENFFHPFTGDMIRQLNQGSLAGLFDPVFLEGLIRNMEDYYESDPCEDDNVEVFFSEKKIDTGNEPYANYNWELFFHLPLSIALHLSKNQRFAEAQRWFHYIFDPTSSDGEYWRFIAFRKEGGYKQIDESLDLLGDPDAEWTQKKPIIDGYEAITRKPFQPHAVARTRPIAYMYSVVMKYLDNLIAWGDNLFQQDTLESLNEATQIYVLASNILGKRPEVLPFKGANRPKTFAQLKVQGTDRTGNIPVELEGLFPFNHLIPEGRKSSAANSSLFGIMGSLLYFCIPRNDKLLGYWDTVSDRLFKIRHCMNISGAVRQLALFDPPLDPGMLVKAKAAGIDIGAIVTGTNQPVTPLRAKLLIQKALELCTEVRSLGSALLSAIEKKDAELLAQLRQEHEVKVQKNQKEVRFLQWKQTQESTKSLLKSREIILERYKYYLRLMGQVPDSDLVPDTYEFDPNKRFTEEDFDEVYGKLLKMCAQEAPKIEYQSLKLADGDTPGGAFEVEEKGGLFLSTTEKDQEEHLKSARDLGASAEGLDAAANAMVFIPDIKTDFHFMGLGGTIEINVGTALVKGVEIASKILRTIASWHGQEASIAALTSNNERRVAEWTLQSNQAALELEKTGREIITSLISEDLARQEYENVQAQIDNAIEVETFLKKEKFSNEQLYSWMQGELKHLYYEYYRFAFDVARKAEYAMKRELMRPELDSQTMVKSSYWNGGHEGLLSGERLFLDVKRMEMAYTEYNQREYELTKHISIQQVDSLALINLRATGRCTVKLPESLFDMDGPGHYNRMIKGVALSIPCVTGPYVGVNCKLTLVKSSARKSPSLNGSGYARDGSEDGRFEDYSRLQSVVASTAQQDTGLFETKPSDERELPFVNAGVISDWQFELPANPSESDPAQFDYNTISDVILHMRYTARDGGVALRSAALQHVKELINSALTAGSVRLFSIRHEFAADWVKFQNHSPARDQRYELAITLRPDHYPYWSQGRLENVDRVDLFALSSADSLPSSIDVFDRKDRMDDAAKQDRIVHFASMNDLFIGQLTNINCLDKPTGQMRLYFNDKSLSDLWVAVTWRG